MIDDTGYYLINELAHSYEMYLPDARTDYIQGMLSKNKLPYELDMLRDMASRLKSGDLVLDIGANVGNHSIYLAKIAHARIVAYEPNKHLVDALTKSVKRNQLDNNVDIRAVGLGREVDTAKFAKDVPENLGAQKLDLGSGDIEITSLDNEDFGMKVRAMKIDVEGMELDVLEGGQRLITADRPLIYVESQDELQFRKIAHWMQRNDYGYLDTFNATPTHLFICNGETSFKDKLDRLLAREVIQEYRYGVQLRRARRLQKAAEDHADKQSETISSTQNAMLDLQQNIEKYKKKINHLEDQVKANQNRMIADREILTHIEESTAYRLGLALVLGVTTYRGLINLPSTFFRLIKRGFTRRFWPITIHTPVALAPAAFLSSNETLREWIRSDPRIKHAVTILYADINLNIVDGSSVWMSSMASILCAQGVCILISKSDIKNNIIISNIEGTENLFILTPEIFGATENFEIQESIKIIKELDGILPRVQRVVIRGLDSAVALLQDRQLASRSAIYLTDFYSIVDRVRQISHTQLSKMTLCLAQANIVLAQTPQIEAALREIKGADLQVVAMPPPIPADKPIVQLRNKCDGVIRVGYAGKINSRWGIIELLEWVEKATSQGYRIELHIVASKISNGPDPGYERLSCSIIKKMSEVGANHYTNYNRSDSIKLLSKMDFVWCWRPARFEEHTLELSTKLVEMAALGARCVCYPSSINKDALGNDYPYFIEGFDGFLELLHLPDWGIPSENVATAIMERHSLEKLKTSLGSALVKKPDEVQSPTVLFAGHDFKFIDSYISYRKASGDPTLRDVWEWGKCRDESASRSLCEQSDIIFCEWGLANAAWYSKIVPDSKRLIVRVHAQEIRERARRFGAEISVGKVHNFVFVSEYIRQKSIELWGWPLQKTVVVPNYVLENEYTMVGRKENIRLALGMLGIVPTLKRFDRALDLLGMLSDKGIDVILKIKGNRPEDLEFMHAQGRRQELEIYFRLYERIENDERLRDHVHFEPWGNDVADWYKGIDIIISPSDSESFHYAIADGVLSGCYPVIWPWLGAEQIYDKEWIIQDVESAVRRISDYASLSREDKIKKVGENREFIVARYGSRTVFEKLNGLLVN